jgi:thiol-disulfide isomerase/thioredoxin
MDAIEPLPIGQAAPLFTLADLNGVKHSLTNYRNKIVVINFWSAECPWSHKFDPELLDYSHRWEDQVSLLTIASNANEPREMLIRVAAERNLPIVLHDSSQNTADLYGAKTTPHLFVLDQAGILRYHGAFNDITFRQREATANYLYDAVVALLNGKSPEPSYAPPYGCTIMRQTPQ